MKPSGKPTRGALSRVTVESDLPMLKGALAALFICAETHLYGGGQERRGEASGGLLAGGMTGPRRGGMGGQVPVAELRPMGFADGQSVEVTNRGVKGHLVRGVPCGNHTHACTLTPLSSLVQQSAALPGPGDGAVSCGPCLQM